MGYPACIYSLYHPVSLDGSITDNLSVIQCKFKQQKAPFQRAIIGIAVETIGITDDINAVSYLFYMQTYINIITRKNLCAVLAGPCITNTSFIQPVKRPGSNTYTGVLHLPTLQNSFETCNYIVLLSRSSKIGFASIKGHGYPSCRYFKLTLLILSRTSSCAHITSFF